MARRRYRRGARRTRRGRKRVRRRWVGRRRRRRTYRRRPWVRRRRPRRRRLLTLKQWQPQTNVRLTVRGILPFMVFGPKRTQRNYTMWQDTVPPEKESYGGSFATYRFSMQTLYDEYMRLRNWWSRSNTHLDLVRYTGVSFRLYRHTHRDYIVSYSLETPMESSIATHMSLHPMRQLFQSKHRTVPSFYTKPGGKPYITLKARPPRLMKTQWYFQHDFCNVGLILLRAACCNLTNPWMAPSAPTPCLTIYAISNGSHEHLSINADDTHKQYRQHMLQKLYNNPQHLYNNHFRRHWSKVAPKKNGNQQTEPFTWEKVLKNDTIQTIQKNIYQERLKETQEVSTKRQQAGFRGNHNEDETFNYTWGLYSSILLNTEPGFPELSVPYSKVRYNPIADRGSGNAIWIETLTKDNCHFSSQYECLIKDAPLWLCLYGYLDWCTKYKNNKEVYLNYRVGIRCPYTVPQLYSHDTPTKGWIPLSTNFMNGKMPGGSTTIPLRLQNNWYPMIYHQEEMIEELVASGPFAPRDHGPVVTSSDITIGYKFGFRLGGNYIAPKQVGDPCKQPVHELPAPGGGDYLREVQVTDPTRVGPHYQFHPWDLRRGLFSEKSLKRVREDSDIETDVWRPSKYAKPDPPAEGRGLAELCSSVLRDLLQETQHSQSPFSQAHPKTPEETPTVDLQRLQREIRQQQQQQSNLQKGIKNLVLEMVKYQRHLGVDPCLR
ncbi:ORF1 [Simian torque teno virus 34]|uniref:Capsid protein n=1 Tax=Simian torque teno virus 34 TaxID=1629657 RepID=A0A0C5IA74_9VIRU|nr:ORF1 [Simian torque teno virus 34]AJP36579.1 ORF1 [Simian torque teno virus 34]